MSLICLGSSLFAFVTIRSAPTSSAASRIDCVSAARKLAESGSDCEKPTFAPASSIGSTPYSSYVHPSSTDSSLSRTCCDVSTSESLESPLDAASSVPGFVHPANSTPAAASSAALWMPPRIFPNFIPISLDGEQPERRPFKHVLPHSTLNAQGRTEYFSLSTSYFQM